MPEPSQFTFTHRELVELMLKKANVHEGTWMLSVTFGFAAINGGPSPDQAAPAAVAAVQAIGIQRAVPDSPPGLLVDAAEVNPAAAKPKRKKD